MTRQEKMTLWVLGIAMVIGIVLINRWAANRDIVEAFAAVKYEECVYSQYHTTPSAWYQEHGEYPPCEE